VADTILELYQGSTMINSNDDWKKHPTGADPGHALCSARQGVSDLVNVVPGAYTMIVRGKLE